MKIIRTLLTVLALIGVFGYAFYFLFEWQIIGKFQKDVDWLFWACVKILQVWGDWTGLGYNLLNILVFIILQPVLILIFFVLWRLEVSNHKRSKY